MKATFMRIFVTASKVQRNAAQALPITIPSGTTSRQSRITADASAGTGKSGVESGGGEAFTMNAVELERKYQKLGQSKEDPADFVCEPVVCLR